MQLPYKLRGDSTFTLNITKSCSPSVMVNFMWQLDWSKGCPERW